MHRSKSMLLILLCFVLASCGTANRKLEPKQGSLWIKKTQIKPYLESYLEQMRTYCAPQVPQMDFTMFDDRFQIYFTCVDAFGSSKMDSRGTAAN